MSVCVSRYGTGWFTIQSVRSNDDYLVLRDRTGSDGSHCLVATELEANSKSLVPSIVTMHFLLLVRCQHVYILVTIHFDWCINRFQISTHTLHPFWVICPTYTSNHSKQAPYFIRQIWPCTCHRYSGACVGGRWVGYVHTNAGRQEVTKDICHVRTLHNAVHLQNEVP